MTNEISEVLQQLNEDGEHLASDLGEGNPAGVNLDLNTSYKNAFSLDPSQLTTTFSTPANSGEDHDFRRYFKDPFGDNPFQLATSPTYGGAEQMEEGSGFNPPEQLTRMEIDIIDSNPLLREWSGSNSPEIDAVLSQINFSTSPANDNAEGPPPHQLFDTSGSGTGNSQLGINSLLANTNAEQMEDGSGSNPPEERIRMETPPSEIAIREHIGSQDSDSFLTDYYNKMTRHLPEIMKHLKDAEALESELEESHPVLNLALRVVEYYEKGIRPRDLDYPRLISESISRTVDLFTERHSMLDGFIFPHTTTFTTLQDLSERLSKIIITEEEVCSSTPKQTSSRTLLSGKKQAGSYFEDIEPRYNRPLQGGALALANDVGGPSQFLNTFGMGPSLPRTNFSIDSGRVSHIIYDTDELEDLMKYVKDCKCMFSYVVPRMNDYEKGRVQKHANYDSCPMTLMPLKDYTPGDDAVRTLIYRPTAITTLKTGVLGVCQFEVSLETPRYISLPQKRRRAKTDVPLETLLKHCNKTLEQAARDIGVSETKLKDVVKEHGYKGWLDFKMKNKNTPSAASTSFMQVDGGSQLRMQPISSSATETNSKPVMVRYGKFTFEFDLTSESKMEDLEREMIMRADDLGSFYMEYKNQVGVWIRIACYDDMRRCMDSFTSSAGYAIEMRITKKRRINKGN